MSRDVYGNVLAALDDTAIISVNESCDEMSVGELRVEYVRESPPEVDVRGYNGTHYRIQCHRGGPEIYKITEDGLSYETDVVTIELVGMAGPNSKEDDSV